MWVFAYGSLMWRPGFDFVERRMGVLRGYHRALCVYSHVHRGTPKRPGLVLGLDRGGSCRGAAFLVASQHEEATLAYLRERELVTDVYREKILTISLDEGEQIRAIAYVVDVGHPQYAGKLPLAEQLSLVLQGVGQSGRNVDYVVSTSEHLDELGVSDLDLKWLATQARRS